MKKRLKLLITIVGLSLILLACGSKERSEMTTLDKIEDTNLIKVGITADYPPYEFYRLEDGLPVLHGMDIELAKYIGDRMDKQVEFIELEFSNLLTSLAIGRVDMIISGMNPTDARREQVDFTKIYHKSSFSLLSKEEIEDFSIDSLKGKKIGVQMGSTQESLLSEIEGIDLISFEKNPDIIMNIKTKKIDYGVMEGPVARSFMDANKGLKLYENIDLADDEQGMAIAIKKGEEELRDRLDKLIDDIEKEELMDKWFIQSLEKIK